jgi:hypothetical protein
MFGKGRSFSHVALGRPGRWTAAVAVLLTTVGFAHDGQPLSIGDQAIGSRTRAGAQPSSGVRQTDSRGTLPSAAQAHISSAIGKDQEVYHAVRNGAGVRLDNPDHAVSANFTSAGVRFRLGTGKWGLTLRGHGYGDLLLAASASPPTANANRVEYRRGALTEWYVNGPIGLEQGFTLQEAPKQANGQPLTLAFTVEGNLDASVDSGARDLTLSKNGAAAYRYAGLRAWDANRRELRTWLEMAGKDLRVRVDDAGARYPVTIDPVVQAAKLVAQTMLYGSPYNDGVAGDQLGRSMAISDDGSTVVVGAPFKRLNNIRSGVAYVFVRPSEQEGGWNSVTPLHYANRLQASDFATSGLTFGMSVAVSGDGGVIVVGATGVNQAIYQGAAYVYVRMIGYWGGGWALAQTAKLTPFNNTGSSNFGGFGTSVSIADNGATIVVGSPNRSDLNGSYPDGAVHAFFRPAVGWVDMTQSATVSGLAATGLINTRFGSSVSLSGDRWFLVVGSPGEWDYRGAAYLFMLSSAGGTLHYEKLARFFKNDGGPYEAFGNAVAININGSNFAVSAPGAPIEGRAQGAILVYERPTTQLVWILKARLTMANGVEDDALGSSLSMSGDGNTIVAGSPHYPGTSAGAAYVFVKPVGGWINSTENAKRQADDIIAGDNFGHAAAVSADGETWAVAAPFATIGSNARQGSAYVFTGIADNPVAAVSPSSLMFGPSEGGQNPGPQTVTLTNAGAGPLIVTGVSVTGQFTSTQNCLAASPLGPGSSCSEQVAFAPLSTELTTGTLTFTDNSTGVAGSTQTVGLQGYGIKVNTSTAITAVSANPALLGQPVSVSFAVTAQSGAMATPSGIVTVQASTGETCTASAPSGSCALTFSTAADRTLTASYSGDTTFKPSTSPAGSLTVVDFGLSVSPASQTVQGRKATYIVTVTGVNGFAGTVALSCSGGPTNTTCAMSPQSLTLPSATTTSKAAVTLPAGARGGTYVITFSGSFGGVMRTGTATLVKPATLAK